MTKLFSLLVILVVAGAVYFAVQNIDNSPAPQEGAQSTESLPSAPKTIEPEEEIIEPEADPVTEPAPTPPAPTQTSAPDPNQGIDTLPPVVQPEPTPTPDPVTVIILANDITADPKTITVEEGAEVTLIFQVDTQNVAFGGLDFRSPVVDTGTISPGESETVSFTALASFDFTPFWPSSGVMKGYKINIVVE